MSRRPVKKTLKKTMPRRRRKNSSRQSRAQLPPVSDATVLALPVVNILSESETRIVEEYKQGTQRSLSAPPAFVAQQRLDGIPEMVPDPTVDPDLWNAQFGRATGSRQRVVQEQLSVELYKVHRRPGMSPATELSVVLEPMIEVAPKDALEGRLLAQMLCAHKIAMDCLAKGMDAERSIEVREFYLRHAERLMRLFGHQMDSLTRYRGKTPSEQRVTVEHVHVYDGGQAVVGNVATPPRPTPGGGDETTNS